MQELTHLSHAPADALRVAHYLLSLGLKPGGEYAVHTPAATQMDDADTVSHPQTESLYSVETPLPLLPSG